MFELFFIIGLANGQIVREYWPDNFISEQECTDHGVNRTQLYSRQILEKYPEMVSFDISCERRDKFI
ncbi:MAG: hypothetical protein KTR16_04920 [Acidiferrobacterales bacterium]|nr:hypothetical protein [Acidiferrobacterales bacterium]